jgi:thiol:disulfide interchange protein DsbC
MTRLPALLAAALLALPALANEALIRQAVEAKLGGIKVDAVQPSLLPGLYEVRFQTQEGPQIVYVDAQANHIFLGDIIEFKTDRNLTQERIRKLSAIKFESLPLELAVKVQRGNGKRVLALFSDPYCPACQQFEKVLAQVEDVTIYYFMYPVIRPELADHSKAVWCAPDRGKAWLDLALRGKPSATNASCDNPVAKVLELGRSLRVGSTPTLILGNGERLVGGLPPAKLRAALDEAAKPAPKK